MLFRLAVAPACPAKPVDVEQSATRQAVSCRMSPTQRSGAAHPFGHSGFGARSLGANNPAYNETNYLRFYALG